MTSRARLRGEAADPWAVSDAAIRARLRGLLKGQSIHQIGLDLGLNRETVRRQLVGRTPVGLELVAAAAARHHVSLDWLVWGRSASDDQDRQRRLAHVARRLDRAEAQMRALARDVARERRVQMGRPPRKRG